MLGRVGSCAVRSQPHTAKMTQIKAIRIGKAAVMGDGVLYVVSTPIGHLDDITIRAVEILRRADLVAAEDTRRSRALLTHIGAFPKPLVSCNEQNEGRRASEIVAQVEAGKSVALVSDAGTPLISDPGFRVVRAAFEAGQKVVPIPGPSALGAALSVCPLGSERFVFQGFLPSRAQARRGCLRKLDSLRLALVLFEAPHRLLATLEDILAVLGNRRMLVARELTKMYETLYLGSVKEIQSAFVGEEPRGEIVLLVEKADEKAPGSISGAAQELLEVLLAELPASQAARLTAKASGESRGAVYRRALELSP